MKIKDLLHLLQSAPEQDKEVWIPSIEDGRTTNISFNFDDINNLELYESAGEYDEEYIRNKISQIKQIST